MTQGGRRLEAVCGAAMVARIADDTIFLRGSCSLW